MQVTRREAAGEFEMTLDSELKFKRKLVQPFIDELKEKVPFSSRFYDRATNVWTIDIKYYSLVRELHEKYFMPKNQIDMGL